MRQYDPPRGSGADMTSDQDDLEPHEIRVEIEQTRTEMSGTIDAIQRRLAPDVLTEQAKDIARDATEQAKAAAQDILHDAVREVKDAALEVTQHAVHEVKEAAREVTGEAKDAAWDATVGRAEGAVSTAGETAKGVSSMVMETIKQHPIPAALAGLSLFWLYRHRAASQVPSPSAMGPGGYRSSGSYMTPGAQDGSALRTGYATQAQRNAGVSDHGMIGSPSSLGRSPSMGGAEPSGQGVLSSVTETVSGAASQAGEVASDMMSSAGQMASNAASSAGHAASATGDTAMDLGSTILTLVQNNPVPAALVGIGLGWLYKNRSAGQANGSSYPRAYSPSTTSGSYAGSSQGSGVGDMARQAGDLARQAGERAGEMAGEVQERAGDITDTVQEHVGDFAGAVKDRTVRAPGQIQRMIEDNPLLTAALAASLGGAVGLALPPTDSEDQTIGSARDRVMGRAQQMTSDAMDKVQSVAKEAQTTASKEAQSQGLTV